MFLQLATYVVCFVFLSWFLISCNNQPQEGEQLSYLVDSENGLRQTKLMPLFEYGLQYQSSEMLTLKALDKDDITPTDFQEKYKDFKDHYYLLLSLKPSKSEKNISETLLEASGDPNISDQLLQKLQFGLQPHLKLTKGSEELPCVLYHAQPPTFRNGAMLFNLVFLKESNPNTLDDLVLTINIPEFPEEIPSFMIKQNDLAKIPTLKL